MAALSIDTAQLIDLAVQSAKLDNLAVATVKIDNRGVARGKVDNLAVNTGKIEFDSVIVKDSASFSDTFTGTPSDSTVTVGSTFAISNPNPSPVLVECRSWSISASVNSAGSSVSEGRYTLSVENVATGLTLASVTLVVDPPSGGSASGKSRFPIVCFRLQPHHRFQYLQVQTAKAVHRLDHCDR
jgi:hypothetical protein